MPLLVYIPSTSEVHATFYLSFLYSNQNCSFHYKVLYKNSKCLLPKQDLSTFPVINLYSQTASQKNTRSVLLCLYKHEAFHVQALKLLINNLLRIFVF